MKLPRRRFLHLAAGAAALPAVSRVAWAQAYPTRPVRMIVGFAPGGGNDIVARLIGQWLSERTRPAVHHREPAGCRYQHRHRGRRERAPDGYTLLLVGLPQRDQCVALQEAQFQFHPRYCAGCGHCPWPPGHGGHSIGSGQDGPRVHSLCQGQSGQGQMARPELGASLISPGNCSR